MTVRLTKRTYVFHRSTDRKTPLNTCTVTELQPCGLPCGLSDSQIDERSANLCNEWALHTDRQDGRASNKSLIDSCSVVSSVKNVPLTPPEHSMYHNFAGAYTAAERNDALRVGSSGHDLALTCDTRGTRVDWRFIRGVCICEEHETYYLL